MAIDTSVLSDGLEAYDVLKNTPFDMVLCDIRMPEMDGLELMKEIQRMDMDVPFIMVTGFSDEFTYDLVVKSGARDFIKKPFTIEELENKLNRVFKELSVSEENRNLLEKQIQLNKRLSALLAIAGELCSELDFDRLFHLIINRVTEAMDAERTSLYIIDKKNGEIWTKVAQQIEEIRVPLGSGISGRVAESGETINVADAWELDYFDRKYDIKNNFRTRSVLCMPITNRSGENIAVIQVINRIGGGQFDDEDESLLKALSGQIAIALENSFLMEELESSFEGFIRTLSAAVDARHRFTAGHSQRVTEYSLIIGEEMGLDAGQLETIKYAALLHDIGKIGIKDSVLLKNGPFTPEEREEMNKHPAKTLCILSKFHFPKNLEQVPLVATYHHEKMDGKGYFEGLAGNEIPFGSRIIAVADVFDALTSRRDYPKYTKDAILGHGPMPLPEAVTIMKEGAGSHFDQDVVNAFLNCLPKMLTLYKGTHFLPEHVDEMVALLQADEDSGFPQQEKPGI